MSEVLASILVNSCIRKRSGSQRILEALGGSAQMNIQSQWEWCACAKAKPQGACFRIFPTTLPLNPTNIETWGGLVVYSGSPNS